MVSVDKFYVYGGGRWREVDPGSGRIDGWGRAKFLVARGGKLEAARSRPVLAALRSLAEKKPSAAKEGPPLPYKYPRFRSRERAHQGCEHQCCHHSSGSGYASKSNDKKASIAIQCNKVDLPTHKQSDNLTKTTQNSTTNAKTFNQKKNLTTNDKISTTNSKTFNQKRKRDSTSSEELFHAKGVTVATVHSPRKPEAKRRRISNTRNTRNESTSSNDTIIVKKSPKLQLRRTLKRKHSSSGESIIFESKMNRPKKKINESQLRRSARHNNSIVISDDDDENTRKIQYKQRSCTDEPIRPRTENATVKYGMTESSTDEQVAKRNSKSLKDEQIKHLLKGKSKDKPKFQNSSSADPLNTIKQKPGTNEKVLKKPSPKTRTDISSDEPIKSLISPKQVPRSSDEKLNSSRSLRSQNKDITNTQSQNITQDTSKELIIDENDVNILRLYLEKNFPDEDLLRFDTDDDYKKMHFYRINPLVNVERCPRIARMIRDSHDDRLSLVVFASKLGLRSVSEASSVKRYKTRRRDEKKNYVENDIDKENERPSRTTNVNKAKAVRERENTTNTATRRKGTEDDRRERDDTKDTATRRKEKEDDGRERENTKDTATRWKKTEDDRIERENSKETATRRKGTEDDRRERDNSKDTGVKRKEREDMRERENTKDTAMSRKRTEDDRRERDNSKDTGVKRKGREDDRRERENNIDTGVKRKEKEDMKERENIKDTAMRKKERKDDTALRRKEKEDDRIERENTKDSELSNDSGKVKGLKKKTKAVSKRPNEYSNLEDHAIVSWVSVGARACCVNGNRIWRDLQEQFLRITGHERTWHSLRNRYLRYILPRLGSLALPPPLQTRLRAAAATGELKGKRRDAKRNSIFKPPTRGAASRRPGLLNHQDTVRYEDSGHEDNPAPSPLRQRTPRYSDVTRQFAREHRYSSESKSASENINNNKTSVRDTRTHTKDVLSVPRNSEHRNNSSKSRLQGKSRKSDESSTEEQSDANKNKSRIKRKHSLSLRRKRSPSDSSQTSRSKSSDSSTGDSDSSDPNPPRRRSDRLRSHSSPGRKSNRINSPETNRRRSSRINSLEPNMRQSNRINSPETNRRKLNRINSPESNRRSNRINSPETNKRQSNRIISPESIRRQSNRINSPEPNRRSNRINSPESNRRTNRINSPETNRRQSNRNKSPLHRPNKYRDSSTDSSDSVPVQINKRKSNRINSPEKRYFNRIKSPIKSNGNSRETKIQNSNSLSESRRKDRSHSPEIRSNSRRRSSRKAETANLGASSQEKHKRDNSESVKPRTRKLFNPKDIL